MNPTILLLMQRNTTLEALRKRLEAENEAEPVWIVGPETGRVLAWLVRVWRPELVLEIGTSIGYSGLWFAEALAANGMGKLWTVESHAQRFERARANFAESGLGEWIEQVKGHSPEVFAEDVLPERFDFAFYDATKKQTAEFFEAVEGRMTEGGLVVIDNALSHREGAFADFIGAIYARDDLDVVELPVGAGLLLIRFVADFNAGGV